MTEQEEAADFQADSESMVGTENGGAAKVTLGSSSPRATSPGEVQSNDPQTENWEPQQENYGLVDTEDVDSPADREIRTATDLRDGTPANDEPESGFPCGEERMCSAGDAEVETPFELKRGDGTGQMSSENIASERSSVEPSSGVAENSDCSQEPFPGVPTSVLGCTSGSLTAGVSSFQAETADGNAAEDLARGVFLTERGKGADEHARQEARRALFETLKDGPKIREGVDRLHGLLGTLDQTVDKLMADHERDFLLAFRTHMYTVQKQMDYFKQRADEEQTKILKDVKIRALEKELNWFMSEALRLDSLCKQYQKDLDKWRDRADALSEDRAFLETQVKSCKRQILTLQAKVDELESNSRKAAEAATVAQNSSNAAQAVSESTVNRSYQRPTQWHGGPGSPPPLAPSLGAFEPSFCAHESCRASAEFLRAQNTKLRAALDREKRLTKQLRLQQNDASAQKLELESFFMHCCEEVKRDIQMKKSRSVSREGGLATGTLPEEISLQDFLRTDKRHLLELVLANNEVLAQLHECLFRCHAGRGSEPRHSSEEAEKAT